MIQEMLSTVPSWSHFTVVFDSCFNPGESEHKFAEFVRSEISSGILQKGLRCPIDAADRDLTNVALLLYEPKMVIIRHQFFGLIYEIVDIRRLSLVLRVITETLSVTSTTTLRQDSCLRTTSYLEFEALVSACQGVGEGFLVENDKLNRDFLEQLFLNRESEARARRRRHWRGSRDEISAHVRVDGKAISARSAELAVELR
jgi:hypothetical protein